MTLDPKSLNAEERALVDAVLLDTYTQTGHDAARCYDLALMQSEPIILARRAIFNAPPAPLAQGDGALDRVLLMAEVTVHQDERDGHYANAKLTENAIAAVRREFGARGEDGGLFCPHKFVGGAGCPDCTPAPAVETFSQGFDRFLDQGHRDPIFGDPTPAAASPLPEAVGNAVNSLRACAKTAPYPFILNERADALESWARRR